MSRENEKQLLFAIPARGNVANEEKPVQTKTSLFSLPKRELSASTGNKSMNPFFDVIDNVKTSMSLFDIPARLYSNSDEKKTKNSKKIASSVASSSSSSSSSSPRKSKRLVTLDSFCEMKQSQNHTFVTNTYRLDSMFWIKKPVSDTKWKIMAAPMTKAFSGEDTEPYPLYIEGKEWIGVPRFFGIETYGKPSIDDRSLGFAMNPDVKFTWKIQNTSQKPQQSAIDAWISNDGEGVLCLPCGAGKTVIAVYLAVFMHRCTLILVQNGGLLSQWIERIQSICPNAKIGIIQQQKCDIEGNDFVIGMIQTVRESKADFSAFGMVIVDECHHIAAKTFSQSVMKTRSRYILGLSATPERRDGLTHVLHWLLGPLLFKSDRKDITPQQIKQIVYDDGNQKVTTYKNGVKGIPSMVTRMTQDVKRNQLIYFCIEKLLKEEGISKILVLSDRVDHLLMMHTKYEDSGLYIGKVGKRCQEEAKQKSLIFASYSMAKEFLDIDGLNGMVLASPCIVDTEQVIGRLRENLKSAFWFETMENDDIFEENLENSLCNILPEFIDNVKSYLKKCTGRKRIVYDIIDPFDLFDALAWKRFKIYKRLGYEVHRLKTDDFFATMN